MTTLGWILLFLALIGLFGYQRASLSVWTIALGLFLILLSFFSSIATALLTLFWLLFVVIFIPLNVIPLRRQLISKRILNFYRKVMPNLSETEREALTAGNVDWTADLFSGMPDWNKLRAFPLSQLSEEEQAFLDGPVEKLCSMIDNWTISQTMQIPDTILDFLKKEGFFGLIIPKDHGGKEFSAIAHSQILTKVAEVSVAVATVIAVPNSLGPAELLLHYGTEEQKNYYLPRLATGEEIPCFALTSPVAGSDASGITDNGVVCKAKFADKEQLCIRLNWDKRYITLSPIATVIGLAFKLYDPDYLLGKKTKIGITCALIPAHLPGIVTGSRHYPLHSAFPNGPAQGHDVLIPIDWIIGGVKMAGNGWRMLMESLAAGRSISLPSMVTGGSRKVALASGAYARIRRQFNTYIGHFGGIEEILARLAGRTYTMEAVRHFTVSIVDQHQKPAVASAISKCHTTEMSFLNIKDAITLHGGKGICMGPHNYLAQGYIEQPISITVEGANILTRSMIIFGQGAIRCHPYVLKEMNAVQNSDAKQGLKDFDRAIFAHIGFLFSNIVRCLLLGITNGRIARRERLKKVEGIEDRRLIQKINFYYQRLTRFSSVLALLSDSAMMTMGGELKRKEKLSARLGDLLSYLYIASSVLKYFESTSTNWKSEMPIIEWICQDLLYQIQTEINHFLLNSPNRILAILLRIFTFPWGARLKPPSDALGAKVAKLLLEPSVLRKRLAKGGYQTSNSNNPIAELENIMAHVIAAEPLEKKVLQARHEKIIQGNNFQELITDAVSKSILTSAEAHQLLAVEAERMRVIHVDDFPPEYFSRKEFSKKNNNEKEREQVR